MTPDTIQRHASLEALKGYLEALHTGDVVQENYLWRLWEHYIPAVEESMQAELPKYASREQPEEIGEEVLAVLLLAFKGSRAAGENETFAMIAAFRALSEYATIIRKEPKP